MLFNREQLPGPPQGTELSHESDANREELYQNIQVMLENLSYADPHVREECFFSVIFDTEGERAEHEHPGSAWKVTIYDLPKYQGGCS